MKNLADEARRAKLARLERELADVLPGSEPRGLVPLRLIRERQRRGEHVTRALARAALGGLEVA